jgi:sugar/nucleoside kinase (ribokinase family)
MERFRLAPDLLDATAPDWIHIAGYTMLNPGMPDAYRRLVGQASERGVECSVELEGLAQAGTRVDLHGLTVFCNRHEYRMYFGRDEVVWPGGAERLIVKSGSEGCFLACSEGVRHVPPIPATVRDLTGAGDAFNAAFIAARLAGMEALEACRWGNAAGALKVGVPGPRVDMTVRQLQIMVKRGDDAGE